MLKVMGASICDCSILQTQDFHVLACKILLTTFWVLSIPTWTTSILYSSLGRFRLQTLHPQVEKNPSLKQKVYRDELCQMMSCCTLELTVCFVVICYCVGWGIWGPNMEPNWVFCGITHVGSNFSSFIWLWTCAVSCGSALWKCMEKPFNISPMSFKDLSHTPLLPREKNNQLLCLAMNPRCCCTVPLFRILLPPWSVCQQRRLSISFCDLSVVTHIFSQVYKSEFSCMFRKGQLWKAQAMLACWCACQFWHGVHVWAWDVILATIGCGCCSPQC